MPSHSVSPDSAVPADGPRRRSPLLLSNALDASGRQGADLAIDVLAVVVLSATATQMGLLNALGTLAFLVLGIPIGVIVDRSPTVRLLVGAGLVRAALLSTLVAAWSLDLLTLPHLYLVALLAGTVGVVTETTQTTIVPRVVGAAGVSSLVSRLQSAESVVGLVVPAAAGWLVSLVGAGPTLGLAAALVAFAAVVVIRLQVTPVPPKPADDTRRVATGALSAFWGEAAVGWTVLRHHRLLRQLTGGALAINLGLAVYSAIEVVLVLRVLDLGVTVFGLLATAGALGGLCGSFLAVSLAARWGRDAVLTASIILLAPVAALTLMALADPSRAAAWLAAGTFFWGVVMVMYNVLLAGLAAEHTPVEVMGRVSATRRTLTMGVVPLGSVCGGLLADLSGLVAAVAVWVVLNALGAVLVLAGLRRRTG